MTHRVRTEEAERRLLASIDSYGPENARSKALVGVQLTNVHLAQGDGERALDVARRYVAGTQTVRSTQVHRQVATGLRLATRRRTQPGMADVIDLLQHFHRSA